MIRSWPRSIEVPLALFRSWMVTTPWLAMICACWRLTPEAAIVRSFSASRPSVQTPSPAREIAVSVWDARSDQIWGVGSATILVPWVRRPPG